MEILLGHDVHRSGLTAGKSKPYSSKRRMILDRSFHCSSSLKAPIVGMGQSKIYTLRLWGKERSGTRMLVKVAGIPNGCAGF
jgi:hypothetical protein